MKRTILLFFSVVSILSALVAAPIERAVALQYVKQFLSQTSVSQFTRSSVTVSDVESEPTYIAKDAMTGTPHFYVYNLSNDGGFIIVAADTRVRTILGYSFNGGFDEKNIPVNMREWLEEYSSQIAYAIKHLPETTTPPVVTRGTSVNSIVVGPLLDDIMYGQGAPYNDLCPMDGDTRSVTGCVATAMAQVMRYHQHPVQGVGSKTYFAEHIGQNLTVNFSATQYDWANMLPTYNASATDEQKTAVATLMYHAGVAAEMDYSATGSGAYTSTGALALYEHFDYDIGVSGAMRQYYSEEEWLQLIKTELNATRPVIMSGRDNSAGGHAFVCDGYDTNDCVHINWGWGGEQDGYYQLSALNPGHGAIGFNSNQSVYYAIQKPQSGSVANSVLGIEEITVNRTSISGDQTARFNLFEVTGASVSPFSGQLALALYDDVGNFVKIIKIYTFNISLEYGSYYTSLSFTNIGIPDIRPNESAEGTFYIRPVCRPQGEDTWKPVLVENGKVSEIPAVINNLGISFTIHGMTLALSEAVPAVVTNDPNTIIEGGELHVELQISNTGNVEYRAQIGVKAVSIADETQVFELAQVKAVLPVGETTQVNLGGVINFPQGQYKLEAYYDPANLEEDFSFPSTKIEGQTAATEFTVLPTSPTVYFLIEVTANPTAGGTVAGGGSFVYGALLTVTATANTGYTFTNWTENGVEVSVRPNYTITVEKERSLVANFAVKKYEVSFSETANGTLKVFNDTTEIQSGTEVEHGTKLRVEALPDTGYKRVSLQANGQDVINDTVTVTGATEIVAVFAKQEFTVNYTKPANGTLKVFNGETEIQSGTEVEYGTKLRVEALPDTGYKLVSLQANGQDITNDTVTVTGATEIVAVFAKQGFPVSFTNPANGTLKVFNDTTEIQSGAQIEYETRLRVEALPDTGYKLVSLQANGQDVINDTVTVTGATEIVAVFAKQEFPVSFTSPSNGTLKVFNDTTVLQSGAQIEYETRLRVEALPDTGYKLVSLQANGQDVINDTVTVTGATEIVAVFAKQEFPVSFTKPANGTLKVFNGMTEIQSGTPIEYETRLWVESLPDTGYKLVSLQANGQDVVNDTVTVTGATEIVAVFERWVNMDNYRIKATNVTCPGSNDGKIEVSFGKQLDYTVTVKNSSGFEKTERVTETTYNLTDLAAGNYSICFTIEGATNYKQCFEVVISQPQDLSVFKSAVADNQVTYSLSGGTRYTVTHNGRSMETTDNVIRVSLRRGRNVIRITAENECQGVFDDEVYHTDSHKLILFPNPTSGQFSVILPHGEEEVTVEVISILGQSVMKEKRRASLNGLISMNISALPNGIYLVKVNGKTVRHVAKVIKK